MEGYVYILEDENGKYYIGSSVNIERRLRQHEIGHTQTTRNMKSPHLVLVQKYETLLEAREVERKLKKLKRKDYLKKMISDGFIKMKI